MKNRSLVIVLLALLITLAVSRPAHAAGGHAIAYGAAGLWLGEVVLFEGKVDAAAHDESLDLIWFTSEGTLRVVDLRVVGSKPQVIAKKISGGFAIEGFSNADSGNFYGGLYPVLVLGKKSKVRSGKGSYAGWDPDEDKAARKAIKKIQITGTKWIKALAKRRPHAAREGGRVAEGSPDASTEAVGRVSLPAGLGECDEPDACGEAYQFGNTSLYLVVSMQTCHEVSTYGCILYCVLFDPSTELIASPTTTGGWGTTALSARCDDYAFSPDDQRYVRGSDECNLGQTVTCTFRQGAFYVGYVADESLAAYLGTP